MNPISMSINKIKNPLINNIVFTHEYLKLFILAYNNTLPINYEIYKYKIDKDLFNNISKDLVLLSAPTILLKNKFLSGRICILSNIILEKYNYDNLELDENNAVLIIFNISIDNIKLFINQFININTFDNLYKLLLLNKYFNINKTKIELDESDFWLNCRATITKNFKDRKFNNDSLKELEETSDYLKLAINNTNKIILDNNYKYICNEILDNQININDINDIIETLPEKDGFILFCNLLISNKNSHLILNNKTMLIRMKQNYSKFNILFRYLIGYAWIGFYLEEITKKSFITKNDRFIFDIDTASELPLYSFNINNPKLNPYCTILVHDEILNSNNNIGGITEYTNNNYNKQGFVKLDEFRRNLNIFCMNNPDINLFENVNWNELKIALGGSALCACIQSKNPLLNLYGNYDEINKIKRYYNEYYVNSDIDIMFLSDDIFIFSDRVKIFYKQIAENICKYNSYAEMIHVKLKCNKTCIILIGTDDIKKYNLDISDMEQYKDIINSELEKINKYNDKKELYPDYFDFSDLDIKIRKGNIAKTKCIISYKYKIYSPYLDHNLELFMVKYNDFFASVNTFHLPCVRGYYDGDNVYLTPSCISAHLTLMNNDYKYFSGSSNPIEIINKYRMRGFGIWLNENEKLIYYKYSYNIPFWNNLLFSSIKKSVSDHIYGCLSLNNKLFKPREYNSGYYLDIIPVENDYTKNKDFDKLDNIVNIDNNLLFLYNLQTINYDGTINPIKKWCIEAIWDILNKK